MISYKVHKIDGKVRFWEDGQKKYDNGSVASFDITSITNEFHSNEGRVAIEFYALHYHVYRFVKLYLLECDAVDLAKAILCAAKDAHEGVKSLTKSEHDIHRN